MSEKRLIINADDFGRVIESDRAIIDGHLHGIISSVSVFVTHEGFKPATELLRPYPSLGTGIHLDVSSGTPVAPLSKIPSLISPDGQFAMHADNRAIAKINPTELEIEFRAQIEKFTQSGLKLSHLDNHRPDIYFYPHLFAIVVKLASELHLPIRSPFDDEFNENRMAIAKTYKVNPEILVPIAQASKEAIKKNGVRTANHFFILDENFRSEETFINFLKNLKPGITELCSHPGAINAGEIQETKLLSASKLKNLLKELGVQLVNYSNA